ncbi:MULTISPECIES: tyrosine-type recombinase/integrase [Clostridia]|uniref:Site-specific recombinase XerD n=1 Tax=Enterocloster clostridioformis TaxID=1531 RepID=A0A2X2TZH3_9FIRM|nr:MULTISPECIES: tyrosine-type recombinase/integrase [Clostridia]MCA4969667.1 tyrosine-type recombinase/integrase [Clostridioides difficile]MCA4993057.1 tyrosine-type recombinase/integrase [Clostridioides difficile]MCA5576153.1 tyrosine-type recombinase/integrase [Enterocloster clostridioformis]MCA5576222.1 tyrosine-type recombinase/integrase [Enterocloster clostridioformis]MCA5577408.1 tyrosine-type recombinase/integrase [Enterocloster clostridioformis]
MDKYLNSFREMISLRGLTDHTLKNYCTYIRAYLDYLANVLHKSPEDVSWDELRDYIKWLQKSRDLSDRTINCAISQLRFFTMYVLHKTWDDTQLPMRKFDEYLPYVPSKQETWQFISSIPDLKQKTMVTLMYSSGLRIGEVCRLRYEDVDRKNMRLHITHSKNRNDRYAILSKAALDLLTRYWFEYGRPKGFLFPKQSGEDRPIDTFFLSRHIHAHEDRLGWERRLTCHSFRHAFGTHLYENGTDLLTIKALMGHKSLSSTTIYVHLSGNAIRNAVSPFDRLAGEYHE